MTVVDVHAHVIPPALVDAARVDDAPDGITVEHQDGKPWLVHRQGYQYPLLDAFHDAEARVVTMDRDGVDVALLSVAPPMFLYWTDAAAARDAAVTLNDGVAAMVATAPGRFAGLATLPMGDPDAAVAELRRAVRDLGMRGAEIGPHIEGRPLDDLALRPVLATAAELGVPLLLHPYYVGSDPELEDFYLTNLAGNPWQTAVSASRLILSGVLDELPSLDLVLVHGGGYLPYQVGRLDHGHKVRPEAATPQCSPSEYLRRFHYDTLTHRPSALHWLVSEVGSDRVVYGTDVPFDMAGGPLAEQLAGSTLAGDDLARIAHLNAERLFRLDGSS